MESLDSLFRRLEQLNEIGAALSHERDIDKLLERIVVAAKAITRADGGTLYRMAEDNRSLRFEIMRTASLGLTMGGTTGQPVPFAPLPLYDERGAPNNAMVAAYCALHQSTVNIADAYEADGFDFSGTRRFDTRTGYRSKSFLTVPMKNHEGEIIGVLQLINCISPDGDGVVPFSEADQRLAESLASQAAIAVANRHLIGQLEELFESFIKLINLAIDEKSPYTGGHCQRVPALTMMLAEAVNDTSQGPLAAFTLSDKDRYELKIAGLLHDCGKVTTPVHVVDKATKLQTLFDRIELVDTRFEVLKRDAEIDMLRAQLALRPWHDAASEARLGDELRARLTRMEEDREFLRQANIGVESMPAADQERAQRIGRDYQWRDMTGRQANFLSDDEIENLAIRAGTLTRTERDIINHHIVATIRMLDALPWPKHLANVPEYAGGHHERMDGRGYPKGLKREQMSIQARIMGIADIFEALTARDRPYKHGKRLSESLQILGKFMLGGHIDPDLFDVFVRRKVYLKYAQMFLDPEQIDVVDEAKIPGYAV